MRKLKYIICFFTFFSGIVFYLVIFYITIDIHFFSPLILSFVFAHLDRKYFFDEKIKNLYVITDIEEFNYYIKILNFSFLTLFFFFSCIFIYFFFSKNYFFFSYNIYIYIYIICFLSACDFFSCFFLEFFFKIYNNSLLLENLGINFDLLIDINKFIPSIILLFFQFIFLPFFIYFRFYVFFFIIFKLIFLFFFTNNNDNNTLIYNNLNVKDINVNIFVEDFIIIFLFFCYLYFSVYIYKFLFFFLRKKWDSNPR